MDRGGDNWRERAVRDAILAGDGIAWRAWYDEHFSRLADYARWRCGGLTELADDVIQDTWLTAVRRLRTFDPQRGLFFAWLCGIASQTARNAIRNRRRLRCRSHSLDATPEPPTGIPDPSGVETAERVAAALAAIPDRYEAVLRAKYLDRQTVDEIAATRGESPKTIESLLTRARQAFREAYESPHE
jgi:RNA polymerase sigma-70 factor (ECF subfamily)